MTAKIYQNTLPESTALLVKKIQREKPEFLSNFYLSGGTALSLQLGHRESEDLDFFSKDQFLEYPYPLLEEIIDWQGIKLSSIIDVACTKLQTISMRGSKKDFIDLYFLLAKFSLDTLFKKLAEKYQKTDYNLPHILKSLVYFEDADNQPMPRMHKQVEWEEVKRKIIEVAKSVSFSQGL
jgi:hypothetical protein